ncbi:MAG: ABC transporter ATP-binding protein [Chloroflexi bacterium]|nr:MAG: ABC transporter ATP-binding protein [Chloroflexota bacterium]
MRGIVKRFPGVLANDHVDLALYPGEVHALLGENGAGKSTLMNILSGLYRPDAGQIIINGEPVTFNSPRDAIRRGIGMVHQHFMLVPTLTVAENLILGQDDIGFILDYTALEAKVAELSQKFGLAVDPHAKIWQLSVGEQQRVEILKMLYHGAKILIMDEPTAVLTPQEVEELFKTLREMAAVGHTIIFISHKLDEVLEIADRVTVLRRGKVTAVVDTAHTTKAELARLMVGREVLFRVEKKPANPGNPILEIQNLNAKNDRGLPALRNLSLTVRSGEIVGVAGVAGNGQVELAEVITGLRPAESGKILVHGQDITNKPATAAIDRGVAHIPADRTGVGSAPNLYLDENLIMKSYRHPPISKGWAINLSEAFRQAVQLIKRFDVKTPDVKTPARLLSGGNLQKLILARELSREPEAIIAVYPSRGLDAGATEAVHRRLIDERDRGSAILLISEDLDELLSLADRIVVLYEGQIIGEVPPKDELVDEIGLMMAGTKIQAGD